MSDVLILIPAAGASRRMGGRDKLLEQIDGEPILTRQTRRALATGAEVVVTLSDAHPARRDAVDGLKTPALTLMSVDGREGMSVSLRHAAVLAQTGGYRGLMILPADMPELDTTDLLALCNSFVSAPDALHRGTSAEGRPGHPVMFPQSLFGALAQVRGDQGGRDLITDDKKMCFVPLPEHHALIDLDTPKDWADWRKRQRKLR